MNFLLVLFSSRDTPAENWQSVILPQAAVLEGLAISKTPFFLKFTHNFTLKFAYLQINHLFHLAKYYIPHYITISGKMHLNFGETPVGHID